MKRSTFLKTLAVLGTMVVGGKEITNATAAEVFEAFKKGNDKAISISQQGQNTSAALATNLEGGKGPEPKLDEGINTLGSDPIDFALTNVSKYFPDPKVADLVKTLKEKIKNPREKDAINSIYGKLISGYKTEKESIIFIISTLCDAFSIDPRFSDTYRTNPTDLDVDNFEKFQNEYYAWLKQYNKQLKEEDKQLTEKDKQLTNQLISELNSVSIEQMKKDPKIYKLVKDCKKMHDEEKRSVPPHVEELFTAL